MKKIKYLGILLVAVILLSGCSKTDNKKIVKEAFLNTFKDAKAISLKANMEVGVQGMKMPMNFNIEMTEEDIHIGYNMTILTEQMARDIYMKKSEGEYRLYLLNEDENKWIYTTLNSEDIEKKETPKNNYDEKIEEILDLATSIKKVKTDKDGYDKYEVTFSIDKLKNKITEKMSDNEKEQFEESLKIMNEEVKEIKINIYLKDKRVFSIAFDFGNFLAKDSNMTMDDLLLEIVGINEEVKITMPEEVKNATYVKLEEMVNFGGLEEIKEG